jgi:hypothetical protein
LPKPHSFQTEQQNFLSGAALYFHRDVQLEEKLPLVLMQVVTQLLVLKF